MMPPVAPARLERIARALAAWLFYPSVMGASAYAGWLGISRGVPTAITVTLAASLAAALVLVAERTLPFAPSWRRSHGDVRADLGHLLLTNPISQAFVGLAATGCAWLAQHAGLGLWPNRWPFGAQVALAVVIADLAAYWAHRAQHHTALWRFHAVHHSAPRLYWMNATRVHPGEHLVTAALSVLPLVVLGIGEDVLAMFAVIGGAHMFVQHSNVAARLGPLNVIVAGPEAHRFHHSRHAEQGNANYGTLLLVWDVLFRTRFFRERPMDPEDVAGIPGMAFPDGYVDQLTAPFDRDRWAERAR